MFSTKMIAAAAASLFMSSVTADYNPASQANLAMYYGQGPNQLGLAHFCDSSSVDVIPIGFINIFPPLANGLVAENFGNQCWNGNYTGPGYDGVKNPKNDFLYQQCPQLQEDIYYCQTKTKKKILLSLGGDGGNYKLNGAADGKYLAEFLWGAYGPYNATWVANGGVRPLDRGLYNTDLTKKIDIDGFDFDIEQASADKQAGYIACINRLRELFAAYKKVNSCSKTYLISGAPQCPLPEGNMGLTIAGAKFDMLFIQFYNNGANGCTARNYITNGLQGGFNYNAWVTTINQGASAGAKIYLGLLGSSSAGTSGDYLTPAESKKLIDAWHSAPQFGGVMLWEATYAENNVAGGLNYYQAVKQNLNSWAPTSTAPATVCSTTVSSSKTSTTSSKTSSSTKASTTSSTIKTTSTSKASASSSTSSKITSSSSSKVTSSSVKPTTSSSTKISTSSTVKPTSSSVKPSSSASSVKPSSTSTKVASSSPASSVKPSSSSTKLASSSSSSKAASSSSSVVSTTKTAAGEFTTTSLATSSSAAPTPPAAAECAYKGCFTEATDMRALSGSTLADFEGMTIEKCAAHCSEFTFYGLEYTGECYCGNELNAGSVAAPEGECNLACTGDASQLCGGSDRLNVYECGAAPSSSSAAASSTSSTVSEDPTSSAAASSSTSSVGSSSVAETSTSSSSVVTIQTSTSTSEATTSSSPIVTIQTSTSTSEDPTSTGSLTSSSSSVMTTASFSETFTYGSSGIPSSTSESYMTPTFSQTFSYSVTGSSSSSAASETSSSPSSSSEIETTSSSAVESSSTVSGPVTSSTYVSSSSSFPTGPHYTNSSISAGPTESSYPTDVPSSTAEPTSAPTYVPSASQSSGGEVTSPAETSPVSTYAPSSSQSAGGEVTSPFESASASTTQYTTSTVCSTVVETITSCAPTVTNCPVGSVTTKTIPLYTTVCPVTESSKTAIGKPTTTPVATYTPTGSVTKFTTSTVYTTSIYTITSCAPSVTDCPAQIGHVTTEIVSLYTTVCPVTATETPVYTGKAEPSTYPVGEGDSPSASYDSSLVTLTPSSISTAYHTSLTTLSSTTTLYKTYTVKKSTAVPSVPTETPKVIYSTATLMPVPSKPVNEASYSTGPASVPSAPVEQAPYPTGPANGGYPIGTAVPSGVKPTGVKQVSYSYTKTAEGMPSSTSPAPIYATGAASSSRSKVGAMVAVAAGVVAFVL